MKKIRIIFLLLFVFAVSSCAVSQTVATVGNTKITAGEFEFYLKSIKSQLSGTELKTDEDWQTQEIEGKKAIDAAKERALEIAINNAEYCEVAKRKGLTLTADEKQQAESIKAQFVSRYGGNTEYKRFLKDNSITDSFIDMMCKSTLYYSKIAKQTEAEKPITEEAVRQYFDKNKADIEVQYRKAKHILLLTKDMSTNAEFSEEKQAEIKNTADKLLTRALSGEDFDTLMNEYSEDPGQKQNPGGYVFGSGEMVPEFEQAVDSVLPGEITLCKSDYGYHIIKRVPLEYTDVSENIKKTILEGEVAQQIKDWEKELGLVITTNDEVLKKIE